VSDNNKLFSAIVSLRQGISARNALGPLSDGEMATLYSMLPGSKMVPYASKGDYMQGIVDYFDQLEAAKITGMTSRCEDGRSFKNHLHTNKLRDAVLSSPEVHHFIPPRQHKLNLGLASTLENTAAIHATLAELMDAARKDPKHTINIAGKEVLASQMVAYGRKEGSNYYTYYSDPAVKDYLAERMQITPLKPTDSDMVSVTDFCTDYLHISSDAKYMEPVKKIIEDILLYPENHPSLEDDVTQYIRYYRSTRPQPVMYLSPDLAPYIERKLGLFPLLDKGVAADWKTPRKMVELVGINRRNYHVDDLSTYIGQQMLSNPSQLINETNGMQLRDAVKCYRFHNQNAVRFHKDLAPYLRNVWLDVKPEGKEIESWKNNSNVLYHFRTQIDPDLYTVGLPKALLGNAIQELLAEKKATQPETKIQRFNSSHGPLYYIHSDELEAGTLQAEEILTRARYLRDHPKAVDPHAR